MRSVLVTGAAGFIGSAVVRRLVKRGYAVVVLDKLTYSGRLESLRDVAESPHFRFVRGDINDSALVQNLLEDHRVEGLMHLAAESHVDRSIDGPAKFIETNVNGTFRLLQAALEYWRGLGSDERDAFRFHHVSTDEVFGDLPLGEGLFTEETPYNPSSPYSASKAASDHFVRSWHRTYGLPVVLSNCSNNYGPYQFPEKLIPLVLLNAIEDRPIPVYSRGENVRDWLYVDDHAEALELVLTCGKVGESYNIGGRAERTNLEVVESICDSLDAKQPLAKGPRRNLITFVTDRPGHDLRYAIDCSKVECELGWRPSRSFEQGLSETIEWYLANDWWWRPIRDGTYRGERLGTAA